MKFKASKFNEKAILRNTQLKYYIIGLMASDGSVSNSRTFSFSQSGKKGKKLIDYLCLKLHYKNTIYHTKNAFGISFTSENCVKELSKYNIVPRKTLNYKFPQNIPKKYLISFIRGYFDGDGSVGVYKNNKGNPYLCASVVGTKNFISILQSKAPIVGNLVQIKRCKNLYELRWNGKKAITILSWLFTNKLLYKSYKYRIYQKYILNRQDKFTKYEPLKKQAKKWHKKGLSIIAIAAKVNLSYLTIRRWSNNGLFK
jgi:hypothetical protein